MMLQPNRVFCARSPRPDYAACEGIPAPELPDGLATTPALVSLRSLFQHSQLDRENYGSVRWNPFGDLIKAGDTVLIKPNWVHHINKSGHGLDCLVTNTSVIEAILRYVLKARPILVGENPVDPAGQVGPGSARVKSELTFWSVLSIVHLISSTQEPHVLAIFCTPLSMMARACCCETLGQLG